MSFTDEMNPVIEEYLAKDSSFSFQKKSCLFLIKVEIRKVMNYNFSRIVETYHGETVRGNIKNKEKEMI